MHFLLYIFDVFTVTLDQCIASLHYLKIKYIYFLYYLYNSSSVFEYINIIVNVFPCMEMYNCLYNLGRSMQKHATVKLMHPC